MSLTPKLIWSKIKRLPDAKSNGLGMQHENHGKKGRISDDFGLRSPVIRKYFQTKSATSIAARAPSRHDYRS